MIWFEIVCGGCYHTDEKRRMKRRRGCKGCKGSPIVNDRHKNSPKITFRPPEPQMANTLVGWFGRRAVCWRRRVTDSRAERAAVAREGTASDTSPALIKTPPNHQFPSTIKLRCRQVPFKNIKVCGKEKEGWGNVDLASAAVIRNVSGRHLNGKANCWRQALRWRETKISRW